jgi:hypothetical protein
MNSGEVMMVVLVLVVVATLALLVFTIIRSIQDNSSKQRGVWREFGLGLILMILFFVTWGAQAIAEWQVFTDEQREHGQDPAFGDFMGEFMQSTLENWQSEFLQLFSFVTLAALYIHKGSAESKDGEERLEAALRRLEEKLGTLPDTAPTVKGEQWKLPDTPLEAEDEVIRDEEAAGRG